MTARWATSLRVAWRLVRKAPARSALIAVLVALPVLVGTFVAVTIRSAELSPGQAAQRYLGNADAVAIVTPYRSVRPEISRAGFAGGLASEPAQTDSGSPALRPVSSVDVPALLPRGSRAVQAGTQRFLAVTVGPRREQVPAVLIDLADPLTHGMYDVQSGTAPNPGQVALTADLAQRLRAHVGSPVNVAGLQSTVSAIVRNPSSLSDDEVVGPANSLGGASAFPGKYALQQATWLISYPGHAATDLHDALAAYGVIYETRSQWEHPPAAFARSVHVDGQGRAILASVVGFGLAEIILLAGTAFSVGVRRQTRELGLLRAIGGDERDVRRVILSQGVVLGLLGAVIGVALGFVSFVLARSALESAANQLFGPLDARATEVLGVAAIGLVSSVLAAVIPARSSARQSILDMLRTRFRLDARASRVPRWALLALVAGPILVIGSAAEWNRTSGGLSSTAGASLRSAVGVVFDSSTNGGGEWSALISVGAAITLAGIARCCPALLLRLGGHAGSLPLSLRLAVRDAARHRHRTAPAMAAVATVVAGAVLVLLVVSSTDINNRRAYDALQPVGTVSVSLGGRSVDATDLASVTKGVATQLGGGDVSVVSRAVLPHQGTDDRLAVDLPGCDPGANSCDFGGPVGVGTVDLVSVITGHEDAAAASALAAGKAVVFNPALVSHGQVTLDEIRVRGHNMNLHFTPISVPAYVAAVPRMASLPAVVVSPALAATHNWPTVATQGLIRPDHLPSQKHADEVAAFLPRDAGVYVERGYHSGEGVVLLALLGAAALAVLLGTSIAVALAMTESRPDMATFAAVGASPTRRRLLAMGQAATVGSLGTALGLPLGLLVGIALLQGSTAYPFTLPLRWLALLLVSAPLLAVAVAGAVTRSAVPLTRRLG